MSCARGWGILAHESELLWRAPPPQGPCRSPQAHKSPNPFWVAIVSPVCALLPLPLWALWPEGGLSGMIAGGVLAIIFGWRAARG